MKRFSFLIILLAVVCCSKEATVNTYVVAGNQRTCCSADIPIGSSSAFLDIRILTDQAYLWERNYPSLSVDYTSGFYDTGRLKHLDVDLAVNGAELRPDLEWIEAGYGDAFGSRMSLSLKPEECCANLNQKMPYTLTADDGSVKFGVSIQKKFKSTRLPARMQLAYTVTTDRGTYRNNKDLVLVERKEPWGNFFRFH
ncbi:MAG: hypothetical protein JNM27_01385 [Leptospirales bacterium]|nr:hypothetical protein [Leptospirales bacterium]